MEDDVKEDPAKPKEVKVGDQAGWLKKFSGKFLGSYKDCYVQLDKTQFVMYDNEDLKNCLERLDLENYDKCHDLRSPFTKKHRLILTRVPKRGRKVCDVKLQAQTQEDKDAWIKALNDGINRAKNKIFDEVKIENSSLEHVTRSRPKGNPSRRPPTRIHMKDVANISSDGILRLDLDVTDSTPNGGHFSSADGNEQNNAPKAQEALSKSIGDAPEDAAVESSVPQKKVLKPPMPPTKEINPSESQASDTKPEESAKQKKILMPPMPPSKEQKPSENKEEEKPSEEVQEKKVPKPPMPPSKENKPSICSNLEANEEKASAIGVESGAANSPSKPGPDQEEPDNPEAQKSAKLDKMPQPPSKDMKPRQELIIKDVKVVTENHEDADDKDIEEVKDTSKQCQEGAEEENSKTEDIAFTLSNNVPKPKEVMWDSPNLASKADTVEQNVDKPACPKTAQSVVTTTTVEPAKPFSELKLTPNSTPEPTKKITAPPAPPKKKPPKPPAKKEESGLQCSPAGSSTSSPTVVSSSLERVSENVPADDMKPAIHESKVEHKVVILSLSNAGVGEDSNGPCGMEVEEKSVDSGQLSAEESENSDKVISSSGKLEGSFQGLDGETSEDDLETLDASGHGTEVPCSSDLPTQQSVPPKSHVDTSISSPLPAASLPAEISVPTALLNSSKNRAASMGDLLDIQGTPRVSDMMDLRSKVSVELDETGKLLGELGNQEGGADPEILLSAAMEKLRKADQFLREAKSIKQLENKSNRTSW